MSDIPSLTLQAETNGSTVIVKCSGKLTSNVSGDLHAEVKRLLPTADRIVLDLTEVTFMDSMGLGTIATLYVSARTSGRRLEVINLNQRIRDLFTVTHLLSLFEPCGEANVTMP
jgi:anti-sigma B factor antagonist